MIEPNGTPIDVLGLPNRQSKVPGLGSDQRAAKQSIPAGSPNDQAQCDSGFGTVGTSGLSDNVPGKTSRLDDCLTQGQDAGSHQAAFAAGLGPINKGDKGNGGSGDFASPWMGSTKAQGQHPTPGRGDIGVEAPRLLPGIAD